MMYFDERKLLDEAIEIETRNRPIKVAYLIPIVEPIVSNDILHRVFQESYSRWSGIYTLIIPTNKDTFEFQGYLEWLECFDPDIIYSYIDLSENFVKILCKKKQSSNFKTSSTIKRR